MNFAIILILIPLAFALLCFVSGKRIAPVISLFSGLASVFYFLLLLSEYRVKTQNLSFATSYEWIPAIRAYFHVGFDAASVLPLLLTQLIVCLAVLATLVAGNQRNASFYGLIGLAHAGLNGFFCAQNPVTFFVFFELALLPVYFLVLNNGGPNRKKAVFKFFLYTAFGGLLMLAAVLFLQANMPDGLKLENWSEFYADKLTLPYQQWLLVAFLIAFAIKSPVFPFHTWQADLYVQSDKPTLMIIAGVLSKMGVFGLVRFDFMFKEAVYEWMITIIFICLIGVIYGALIAWRQKDIVRILAYSSLSHMSLIAAGILTQTNIGIQGGLFSMLAHGLAAAGLFFAADVIIRRTNDASVEASSGIARVNPRFAAYFFIILLSAVGLPLTCGFIGEFYVIWALTGVKLALGLLAALTLIFGAVYMFRLFSKTMFGVPSANVLQFEKLSLSEDYVFLIIVLLILLFGVFPGEWIGIGHYAHEYMKYVPVTK